MFPKLSHITTYYHTLQHIFVICTFLDLVIVVVVYTFLTIVVAEMLMSEIMFVLMVIINGNTLLFCRSSMESSGCGRSSSSSCGNYIFQLLLPT